MTDLREVTKQMFFKRVKLNHANLNKELSIVLGTISAWHHSDQFKCTVVYTTSGPYPVKETEAEVDKIYQLALEGGANGKEVSRSE